MGLDLGILGRVLATPHGSVPQKLRAASLILSVSTAQVLMRPRPQAVDRWGIRFGGSNACTASAAAGTRSFFPIFSPAWRAITFGHYRVQPVEGKGTAAWREEADMNDFFLSRGELP